MTINITSGTITRHSFETSPPSDFIPIDLSIEDQEFSPPLRGLSWAVDGDIVMDLVGSPHARTLSSGSLSIIQQHGMQIKKIFKGGTTATGLVGWW